MCHLEIYIKPCYHMIFQSKLLERVHNIMGKNFNTFYSYKTTWTGFCFLVYCDSVYIFQIVYIASIREKNTSHSHRKYLLSQLYLKYKTTNWTNIVMVLEIYPQKSKYSKGILISIEMFIIFCWRITLLKNIKWKQ